MGKFDGYLICTDLDGTLYRNDKTVSAENREAIEYFKREGGYFTFVTGRMPYYSWTAYDAAKESNSITAFFNAYIVIVHTIEDTLKLSELVIVSREQSLSTDFLFICDILKYSSCDTHTIKC